MKRVLAMIGILTVLTVGFLVSQDNSKSQTPKQATLSELEYLKLENLVFKQELASRSFQEVQKEFGSVLAEVCKSHGIDACRFDMQNKAVVEVKR